jgi:hypothetical protein
MRLGDLLPAATLPQAAASFGSQRYQRVGVPPSRFTNLAGEFAFCGDAKQSLPMAPEE